MNRRDNRSGFTLVELALAALVIGLGLLLVFGLSRNAHEYATMAEAETRVALFADNVFNGMASINAQVNASSVSNAFERFWRAFNDGETNIAVTASPMWAPTPGGELVISRANADGTVGETNAIVFNSADLDEPSGTNTYEYACRYFLRITLTNRSDSSSWPNSSQVQLDVAPGRSGKAEWFTFTTLFHDHGSLP